MTATFKELRSGDEVALTAAFSLIVPEWADRLVASPGGVEAFLSDESSFVFVADVDGEPAGLAYTYLMRYPDGRHMAYLHELDVREQYRRSGLATALIEASMERARIAGAARFWLSTGGHNEVAQAVYDKLQGDRKPLGDVNYWWSL